MSLFRCSECGADISACPFPLLAADCIILDPDDRVLLVERKHPPLGWALPGGFVELGETVEQAAIREAREETGLTLDAVTLFSVYSDPARDPRHHMVSVVFFARSSGIPHGGDDAKTARFFPREGWPDAIAFDHRRILADFFARRRELSRRPDESRRGPPSSSSTA
jgi:ADP-ribose pyrophosphatase YjhB (NUDIX family)